jgi:hypothetical protein
MPTSTRSDDCRMRVASRCRDAIGGPVARRSRAAASGRLRTLIGRTRRRHEDVWIDRTLLGHRNAEREQVVPKKSISCVFPVSTTKNDRGRPHCGALSVEGGGNFSIRQTWWWCSQSRANPSPVEIPVNRDFFREFERKKETLLHPRAAKATCGAVFLGRAFLEGGS